LLGGLAWLLVMLLPLAALWLAVRGEVTWRRGELVEDRVWLVRSENVRGQTSPGGLALSSSRVISDARAQSGPVCVRTNVRIWLWRVPSETLAYCECYLPDPGGNLALQGACP
jgi:hypothetical protein